MDADTSTPFAGHFQDTSFDLRTNGNRQEDSILWLSFFPEFGTVSLGAYDGAISAYSHEFKSRDPEDVAPFIRAVEKDYGVKVPKAMRVQTEDYLTGVGDSLGFFGDISEPGNCETCGVHIDHLEAFYFPAFEEGGADSIAVHNSFGCYSKVEHMGTLETAGEDALDFLKQILASLDADLDRGRDAPNRDELADFIEGLEGKLQAIR